MCVVVLIHEYILQDLRCQTLKLNADRRSMQQTRALFYRSLNRHKRSRDDISQSVNMPANNCRQHVITGRILQVKRHFAGHLSNKIFKNINQRRRLRKQFLLNLMRYQNNKLAVLTINVVGQNNYIVPCLSDP